MVNMNGSERSNSLLRVGGLMVLLLTASSAVAQTGGYGILCGGQQPPPHVNGVGQVFNSCLPLGVPGNATTYNLTLATDARAAWPYQGTDANATCASRSQVAYRQTPTSCAVWQYTGPQAGYVHINTANNTCTCPTSSDPVWK